MKRLIKYYSILVLTAFIIACGQNQNSNISMPDITKIQLPFDDEGMKMSDVVDSISYICLETDTTCLIGQIDKFIPLDTILVVVDKEIARSVYLFKQNGQFIRRIGNQGGGPEEYLAIEDVTVDPQTREIILLDLRSKRFLIYSFEGNFVKSIKFDFYVYGIESLGGGKLAGYLSYGNNQNLVKGNSVPASMIYDLNNEEITSLYCYSNKDISSKSILNFSTNLISNGKDVKMIMPLNDTIYIVSQTGVKPVCFLDFGASQKELQKEYIAYLVDNKPNAHIGPKKADDMGLALLTGGCFSEQHNFLSYKKGGKTYVTVHNNASGHMKSLQVQGLSSLMSDMDHISLFIPYAAKGNNMYFMVNPQALLELSLEKQNEQTKVLKNSISEESNPIIAVAKMKDF